MYTDLSSSHRPGYRFAAQHSRSSAMITLYDIPSKLPKRPGRQTPSKPESL
ncbi:hypothetical protein ACEPAF_5746 [Sanghuangporus sanghuang]